MFLRVDGMPLTDGVEIARCRELAVPPAWRDVWICRHANGHLQAFGRGEAGRGQCLCHPQWQERAERAVLELLG